MKKLGIFLIIVLTSLLFTIGTVIAEYEVEDFREMTGIIVDKDVGGKSIDYLIEINGTKYFLSSADQPLEEFEVGDNVTMNGTIDEENLESCYNWDFDGRYDGEKFSHIVLNSIVENHHRYGQMRLSCDVDNQYYKQIQ